MQRQTEIAEASKRKRIEISVIQTRTRYCQKPKADQAYNLESARAQQHVVEQEMEVKVVERQKNKLS